MKKYSVNFQLILVVAVLVLAGCQNSPTTQKPVVESSNQVTGNAVENVSSTKTTSANSNLPNNERHKHLAPHNGTLIAFGEEFAHLELVLDASSGQITAYTLDGEAEKSVQIAQHELEIEVKKPKKFTVKLTAWENKLTGETKGATSEFRGTSEDLKNLKEFDAEIKAITIRGREFKNTHFNFPKGNEEHKH